MIHAFACSIPQRARILKMAVESILPQVDTMQVVLNNYSHTPEFLKHKKVTVLHHDNSMEDGSRFIGMDVREGYVLVFDDDILYPSNYVETMIAHLREQTQLLGKPVMVTPMGKVMNPRPIKSYYRDIERNHRAFGKVDHPYVVDVPGACGILWDASQVRVTQQIVQAPNVDICLAKFARENGIACVVVPHEADWLANLMPLVDSPSIFGKYKNNDAKLTEFVNQYV
jgi:hypothetical protein